jgi:hypothetical protein
VSAGRPARSSDRPVAASRARTTLIGADANHSTADRCRSWPRLRSSSDVGAGSQHRHVVAIVLSAAEENLLAELKGKKTFFLVVKVCGYRQGS